MAQQTIPLLTNEGATGQMASNDFGGRFVLAVNGTFDGATVGLQMLGPDGTNYIDVEDDNGVIAITAAKAMLVYLPAGGYRAKITGGTGVALYATLRRAGN